MNRSGLIGCVVSIGIGFGVPMSRAQVTPVELEAAAAGHLQVVPPDQIPPCGTFYSWWRNGEPPVPYAL